MDYQWDHNCAVVDRLYYWEYIIRGTTFTGFWLTFMDLYFIRHNWYADRSKKRIPIYFALWAGINLVTGWFLVYPLTKDEIRRQWEKRKVIGKFNYSLSFLDLDEDRKDWAEELEKQRKVALGLQSEDNVAHH